MKDTRAIEAAEFAMDYIRRLVAAYEVDYELLSDLRSDRDEYAEGPEAWALENPDDAADLASLEEVADGCDGADEARQRIEEASLSVQVRSGWADPGAPLAPAEYEILLATGGPAVRIVGDLDQHGEPVSARIEGQDWGTPWIRLPTSRDEEEILHVYAGCFFFGY